MSVQTVMAIAAVASVVTLGLAAPEASTEEARLVREAVEGLAATTEPGTPARDSAELALVAVISAERLLEEGDRPREVSAQLRLARRYVEQARQQLLAAQLAELASADFTLPPPAEPEARSETALRTADLGREVFSRL